MKLLLLKSIGTAEWRDVSVCISGSYNDFSFESVLISCILRSYKSENLETALGRITLYYLCYGCGCWV